MENKQPALLSHAHGHALLRFKAQSSHVLYMKSHASAYPYNHFHIMQMIIGMHTAFA